jgi:hypothetical protein
MKENSGFNGVMRFCEAHRELIVMVFALLATYSATATVGTEKPRSRNCSLRWLFHRFPAGSQSGSPSLRRFRKPFATTPALSP